MMQKCKINYIFYLLILTKYRIDGLGTDGFVSPHICTKYFNEETSGCLTLIVVDPMGIHTVRLDGTFPSQ